MTTSHVPVDPLISRHNGLAIYVDPHGVFYAIVEGGRLESETLKAVVARLDALEKRRNVRKRQALPSVHVALVIGRGYGREFTIFEGEVVGIVPNRTHPPQLRVRIGAGKAGTTTLDVPGNLVVLPPGDHRIAVLRQLAAQLDHLQEEYRTIQERVAAIKKPLPVVAVPSARTVEDAMDKEAQFLDKLRSFLPQLEEKIS